jgi:hypothetical protein
MSFMVGTLIGITSMGGAALITPFLILIVGVRPVLAVGTDLAYSAVTKIVGAWMHWRQNTVDLRTALYMGLRHHPGRGYRRPGHPILLAGSIPGCITGKLPYSAPASKHDARGFKLSFVDRGSNWYRGIT